MRSRRWNGDFVTTEDGTGIVHIAPGFGEDDYNLLKGTGVPTICPVDDEAKFTAEVPDWAGQFVKDADKSIIRTLKEQHSLVRHDSYTHSYPHCWRCKSPLIYRAVSEWFVSVEKIKTDMLAANDTDLLDAGAPEDRPVRQVAGERTGLGHLAQSLLGQPHPRLALR